MHTTLAFLADLLHAPMAADSVLGDKSPFDVGRGQAPPGSDSLLNLLRWTAWICFGICVGAVMWAGAMMGMSARRGEGGEHAGRLGWTLAGAIVIGSASGIVGAVV
jgi:hypothetical protein